MSRLRPALAIAAATGVISGAAMLLPPTLASASPGRGSLLVSVPGQPDGQGVTAPGVATQPLTIEATLSAAGVPVNLSSTPGVSRSPTKALTDGSELTIDCQEPGDTVQGTVRTTTMWDRLSTGGYVSDAYVIRFDTPASCASLPARTTGAPTALATVGAGPLPVRPRAGWSSEAVGNASLIVGVGERMGVPPRGWIIAVATAIQESSLINLPYLGSSNDHDSLGLFQQRPSQGWGTPAQVMDPVYAATAFYRHLLAVPNWANLPLTQAAQAVQRSATPGAYAQWESQAAYLVGDVTPGASLTTPGGPVD